jgi:hypothetical protein
MQQPLDDEQLNAALQQWKAPAAPSYLEQRVLAAARPSQWKTWLQWLTSGSVSVPVPAAVCAVVLLLFMAAHILQRNDRPQPTLSEFQPVKELKPRLIRSVYENR